MKYKPAFGILTLILLFLLNSCFGVNADITLNRNGSGTLQLEYYISKALDSLGKLDGNERWNTIPVGKADFERSMDRIPDMKLVSFSSKEDDKNIIINAKMEFSNIKALLAFMDSQGQQSVFTGDAQSGRLTLTLSKGSEIKSHSLAKLIADISNTYSVKLSVSFPGEGNLSISDSRGNPVKAGNELVAKGKKVTCSIPLNEILSSPDGIVVDLSWR